MDMPVEDQEVVTPRRAFGLALRSLRKQRGISQERLALEIGLDRTYISMLERGKKGPSIDTIFRLAELLEVKPSDMIILAEAHVRLASQGLTSARQAQVFRPILLHFEAGVTFTPGTSVILSRQAKNLTPSAHCHPYELQHPAVVLVRDAQRRGERLRCFASLSMTVVVRARLAAT